MVVIPIDVILRLTVWTVLAFLSASRIRVPRIGVSLIGSLVLAHPSLSTPPSSSSNGKFRNQRQRRDDAPRAQTKRVGLRDRIPFDICIDVLAMSDVNVFYRLTLDTQFLPEIHLYTRNIPCTFSHLWRSLAYRCRLQQRTR